MNISMIQIPNIKCPNYFYAILNKLQPVLTSKCVYELNDISRLIDEWKNQKYEKTEISKETEIAIENELTNLPAKDLMYKPLISHLCYTAVTTDPACFTTLQVILHNLGALACCCDYTEFSPIQIQTWSQKVESQSKEDFIKELNITFGMELTVK